MDYIKRLRKLPNLVDPTYDPFSRVIRTPSPSVNFCFGKTHGLPLGYSVLLWGPPKSGKSVLSNAIVGQLHKEDKEAIVVKFNTEYREEGQLTAETARTMGIDLERYVAYQTNSPAEVFDTFERDIGAMLAEGAPIRLVIIDSISGIRGRRDIASESIEKQQIGDLALTLQEGLKRILPVHRNGRCSLIITAHARAEMDQWEIKRGHKTRAAASFGVKHHCEYFLNIERLHTKAGRTDEKGNELVDETRKDVVGNADETGHKVRVWMQESSVGPAGRQGEFTLDYKRGIINQHEEVFKLGTRWGIIETPTVVSYIINGETFRGKAACLDALQARPELQRWVLQRLLEEDGKHRIPEEAPPGIVGGDPTFDESPNS